MILKKYIKKIFKQFQTVKLDESFQWFVTYKNWKEFEDVDSHRIVYRSSNNLENDMEVITRLNPSLCTSNRFRKHKISKEYSTFT
ncbi:MAG: hypothetical protein Ct9H90mP10_06530 [Actinomycetota bacterium]|nr:MAG: hypothetical protein Ct9H90mP10_06530 [Actinomycetota bacterium]